MNEQEAVRPAFLGRYRIVTNGRLFRVQSLKRRWWFWGKWVWKDVRWHSEYGSSPEEFDKIETAKAVMERYALADQHRFDGAKHGWQPI